MEMQFRAMTFSSHMMCPTCVGLKALRELRLRPFEGAGLGDAGVVDGLACLTSLESLEFRGCKDTLTDEVGCVGHVAGVRSGSGVGGQADGQAGRRGRSCRAAAPAAWHGHDLQSLTTPTDCILLGPRNTSLEPVALCRA
jgi:hypothetical protein